MAQSAAAAARKPSAVLTIVLTLVLALASAGLLFLLLHLSPSSPFAHPHPQTAASASTARALATDNPLVPHRRQPHLPLAVGTRSPQQASAGETTNRSAPTPHLDLEPRVSSPRFPSEKQPAMPKNKGKGGKNQKRGKNEADDDKRVLVFKEDGQEYAQVTRMLDNGRCEAICVDGTKRLCHIRGKMHKKVWIAAGD